MSIITNVLVIPGVSAEKSELTLLVGLIVDGQQVAWGECILPAAELEQDGRLQEAIHIFQELIIPALRGQPLTKLTALMNQVDQMRHEVTVVRPVTAETPPPRRSRRELFSSLINPAQEIREAVKQPLPPQLRSGVSQALFSAAAMAANTTIVETLSQIYALQPATSPPPLHLLFDDLPGPNDPALARTTAASYGLTIRDGDPLKELGRDGIRLQNRARQLKNRAAPPSRSVAIPGDRLLTFLFDLKGGYSALYGRNTGPILGAILGAIFGLEQSVKPYPLRLVDPLILDNRTEQWAMMKELHNFIRLRKMNTRLIARSGIETAEDIHTLADNACCSGVLLNMTQLGTLHRTIELATAARERNLEVILMGVRGEAAVHTALALNPTLLALKVETVSAAANEINRTLAWREYKSNN